MYVYKTTLGISVRLRMMGMKRDVIAVEIAYKPPLPVSGEILKGSKALKTIFRALILVAVTRL